MARKICSTASARTIWCGQVIAPKARVRFAFSRKPGSRPSGPPMTKAQAPEPESRQSPSFLAKSSLEIDLPRSSRQILSPAPATAPRSPRLPRPCGLPAGGRGIRRSRAFQKRESRFSGRWPCICRHSAPPARAPGRLSAARRRRGRASRPERFQAPFFELLVQASCRFSPGRSTPHIFSRL